MCEAPVTTGGDFQAIPTYQLNYDLAPAQRWSSLCALPHVKTYWNQFIRVVSQILNADVSKAAEDAGLAILLLMDPTLAEEIR